MTSCTINWVTHTNPKAHSNIYEKYYGKVNFSNILQSPQYALTQRILKNQTPRIGLIQINGQDVGMVQILEIGIFKNLIHAVMLDRGPVWFDDHDTPENFRAFIVEFKRIMPKRLGRKIRIIPEIEDSPEIREFMQRQGYKRSKSASYQTATIDLNQDDDALRANLKKKWRGSLQQGEKKDVEITWDDSGLLYPWMMEGYITDKAAKGYEGPSSALMDALARTFTPDQNMLIGRGHKNGKDLGGILIFCHGRSATYQIGWNTTAGRDNRAHHLLLWNALGVLKQRKITTFDLGGMNDETASKVKNFKAGLGGKNITLPGLYT